MPMCNVSMAIPDKSGVLIVGWFVGVHVRVGWWVSGQRRPRYYRTGGADTAPCLVPGRYTDVIQYNDLILFLPFTCA